MGSPLKGSGNFTPQISGVLFSSGQPGNTLQVKTPDSPTMMNIDQNPDDVSQNLLHLAPPPSMNIIMQIHEQIIEDIMGLEEKFGDTLGLPYMESTGLMAPQTVCVWCASFRNV